MAFQSYQSKQINPDVDEPIFCIDSEIGVSIVSIQTDQSRPEYDLTDSERRKWVSIVSIQTDQSRLNKIIS